MNLSQLRAFHAVAQHGTFSAAAIALNVSQPAVTQHVRALEESLGSRLFHRRGSGVELTPNGCDLLPKVHQIVKGLEDISVRLDSGRQLLIGHLTVGLCSPHVAMPLLKRFHQAHPGVQIETRMNNSDQLRALVAQQRVDVAVVTLLEAEPGLVCHKLADQEVLVLVPADHPWATRTSLKLAELADQPFVLREEGSMTRQIFQSALARAKIGVDERFAFSSREAVKEAVANGLGLGVVLDKELGNDSRLVGLRIEDAALAAGEYLIANPEISELGAVRAFIANALVQE